MSETKSIDIPYNNGKVEVLMNYINGEFVAPSNNEYLDNVSPATGVVIAKVPRSTSSDVDAAVAAAKTAFVEWKKLSRLERADYLEKISKAIQDELDSLAETESYDTGKPLSLAKSVDIPRARDNFNFFAGQLRHDFTECHMTESGPTAAINYTQRCPVGVAGLITPWNLPLYLLSWKVAPAIGTGNTVVAKPSEFTPLTADRLAKICHKVGLPKGVFNVVHGTGAVAGNAIVAHPDVPLISFTGGTVTGAMVNTTAAPLFKKVSLELGGKNSTVVFDDVDLDQVVPTVVRASFANQGQICLCGSRLFVHSNIHEKFLPKFIKAVESMNIGDPRISNYGSLISEIHLNKIIKYINIAKEEGGKIETGGEKPQLPPPFDKGYFFKPTIISGLSVTSRCSQEEIFGPVIVIHQFNNDNDIINYINNTKYGLAGSLFTNNLTRAHSIAQQWETGMVWVNTWLLRDLRVPFGGVKESGIGREGGRHALEFWTNAKNICIKM